MIMQILLSYKDYTIFFIEGSIGEQKKGQIRFPNRKGINFVITKDYLSLSFFIEGFTGAKKAK